MHRYFRKTSISLSVTALWRHTRTSIIYHHQWGRNQPWEQSPRRHVMGYDKPTVAGSTFNSQGMLPACLWPPSQGKTYRSGYRGKWCLNKWINWWYHHHYHWGTTLSGAHQELSYIDHPQHIQTSAVRQTPETRWPPLTPKTRGRRSSCLAQDMSGLRHLDPLSTCNPTVRKGDSLGTQHQGIPSINKIKYRQALIPHWQAQSCSSHNNTSEVLPGSTPQPPK